MRLARTYTVVLVGAFVLPTVGMGVLGHRALVDSESTAGDRAAEVAMRAEQARLQELTGRAADHISAELADIQHEVEGLAHEFEGADPTPVRGLQRAHVADYAGHDTAGLPAYGYVDATFHTYTDWEHRGVAAPWISPVGLARLGNPSKKAEIFANIHRGVASTPALQRFDRFGDKLDLVWIVTLAGVNMLYPEYDFRASTAENPGALEVDESTLPYVTLGSPAEDPDRTSKWTDPYVDRFKGVWMTSVVHPITLDGIFAGTAGADVLLATIRDRIRALDLDEEGFPALVGPHGEIIATTDAGVEALAWTPELKAALLDAVNPKGDHAFSEAREALLTQTRLTDAPDPGVVSIGRTALLGSAGEARLQLHGAPVLVAHAPIEGPGWGLVVVVPEEAVVRRADSVRSALAAGAGAVRGEFTVFGATLFAVGLGAALLLQHLTIRPLLNLSRRVAALTFDRLVLEPSPPRADEIGLLENKVQELCGLITAARDGERAEHGRLEAVLASMADAVIVTDSRGKILLCNPMAELLVGREESDALGHHLGELLALRVEPTDAPLPDPTARVLAAAALVEFAERIVATVVGEDRALELRGAPLGTVGGGAVLVFRDVTRARKWEEELARVQKLETVQVLAAGIAHDFNNLLAGVLGYVSLARVAIPESSPAQDRLLRAESAIDRARGLTSQLLTFARGGAPVRSVSDIRPVITDAAELALRGSACQCDYDFATNLQAVEMDQGQVAQVIQNLVINATQSMPSGGRIVVTAVNEDNPKDLPGGAYVRVEVADRGSGIAKEHLSRVFDPFYTTKPTGSGLGLAVCFSIVTRHGGRIALQSRETGTTVTFWLPAAAAAALNLTPSRVGVTIHGRVLVMDDDADLREVTTAMLERFGCDVQAAADGVEAVQRFATEREQGRPFRAVILDLTVPGGMGGAETLRRLRVLDPEVVAVVCSGYGEDPVLANPQAYGFKAALRKPFTLAALGATLDEALSGR